MKTGRRTDPDGPRRVSRERDAALGRVRKRPSMLLEFQGKHYNHREPSRDRFHHRYDQHNMGSGIRGAKRERFGPAFFKSEMSDSRPFTSTPPYPRTHHSSLSLSEETLAIEVNNTNAGEGDAPTKRPRLLRDMQLDGPSGADSVPLVGSVVRGHPSPPHHSISSPPRGLGLRAYLEDIDSDEEEDEDVLTVDEEEKPPQPPHPSYKPSSPPTSSGSLPLTKEQLLLRMEAVDREIAATEAQIAALQKRQAELEDTISSPPSPLHSSPLPSPAEREGPEEEGVSSPTATPAERWGTPKRSILESVYSENKVKARTAHAVLYHISPSLPSSITNTASPLYAQPWEAPGYFNIVARHRHFRSKLVQLIGRQKRERHEKVVHIPLPLFPASHISHLPPPWQDLLLCQTYDDHQEEWRKRLDKIENSSKRK
ncbi:Nuclear receptor corepressor 2, partial [Geodia barretti]